MSQRYKCNLHSCDHRVLYNLSLSRKLHIIKKKKNTCILWVSFCFDKQRRKYKTVDVVIIIKCLLKSKIFQVSLEDIKVGDKLTTSISQPVEKPLLPKVLDLRVTHFVGILILKSGLTGVPITLKSNLTMNYSDIYKKQFRLFFAFLFVGFFFRSVMQIRCKIKVFTSTFGFHDLMPSSRVCKNNNPYGFS